MTEPMTDEQAIHTQQRKMYEQEIRRLRERVKELENYSYNREVSMLRERLDTVEVENIILKVELMPKEGELTRAELEQRVKELEEEK